MIDLITVFAILNTIGISYTTVKDLAQFITDFIRSNSLILQKIFE